MMCPACAAGMPTVAYYTPHEVTIEGKKGWLDCRGAACSVCRAINRAKNWKFIVDLIRSLFGKNK